MANEVDCYEDKVVSLILLINKPYGIRNCSPNPNKRESHDFIEAIVELRESQ
jgi:hypothetical protein